MIWIIGVILLVIIALIFNLYWLSSIGEAEERYEKLREELDL